MKRRRLVTRWAYFLLLSLVLSAAIEVSIPAEAAERTKERPSPEALFHQVSQSVFIVEGLGPDGKVVRQGSGVVVAPKGVATNCHVVEASAAIRVRRGTTTLDAVVAHVHPSQDLCQLHVAGLNAPPVAIRSSKTLQTGERVYAVGAPQGLELTFSEGVVSGIREYEGIRLIQTTSPISRGSSGGGLFDSWARLVGLTTFLIKEGQNLNFAFPAELVADLPTYPSRPPVKQVEGDKSWGGTPRSGLEGLAFGLIRKMGLLPAYELIVTEYPMMVLQSLESTRGEVYKRLEHGRLLKFCERSIDVVDLEVAFVRVLLGDPKIDEKSVQQLGQVEESLLELRSSFRACGELIVFADTSPENKAHYVNRAARYFAEADLAHEKTHRHLRRILQRLPHRSRQ